MCRRWAIDGSPMELMGRRWVADRSELLSSCLTDGPQVDYRWVVDAIHIIDVSQMGDRWTQDSLTIFDGLQMG